jgi:FlaA1/EpsC-like NDP-sugar epimerase/lipopolysaccharide/colanic/teichoic acid biosynthesis glycosyltransferase
LKRVLDVTAASLAMVAVSPFLLLLAALLKLEGRGPVFIHTERMGRRFIPFLLVRFRDGAGRSPVAHALHKLRLDGLPQLLNVLRGDMSLVGPRPEPPRFVDAHRRDFEDLLEVQPGLFSMASTCCRGEETLLARSEDPEKDYLHVVLPERIRWEKTYLRGASLWLDLVILGRGARSWLRHQVLGPLAVAAGKVIEQALPHRRVVVAGVHVALIAVSNLLAYVICFEGDPGPDRWKIFLGTLPLLGLIRVLGFLPFRLFSGLWRYVSVNDLGAIIASVSLSSVAFGTAVLITPGFPDYPRRVLVVDWLLLVFLLSGIRLVKRVLRGLTATSSSEVRVLVVGAGDAGEMLLREIEMNPAHRYRPVGLVDDDLLKRRTSIRGVPVLGTLKELDRIIAEQRPDEIVIAAPAAPPEVVRETLESCRKFGLPVKALPGLRDILCGRGLLEMIKDVAPENLLGRAPIALASPELDAFYRGKSILVTGAGGSIGSELVRQLARFEPARLVLFERHEFSLYQLELELRKTHPTLELAPVIGDILDSERVKQALIKHKPAILFHAAAYKHVPMMEQNPREAVRVNVVGTRRLAQLAARAGVERFVLISSDKAVEPTSVMGRTKRLAELTLKHLMDGERSGTRFMAVRFGNVLESSGSVVPLFKDQIKRGGPVTVTHPDVTRYFMTTAEAVHLVLHAARMGEGGEIFVLDMGQPVRLLSMTKRLISLYGYEPARDIEIVFTGLRPGEKLHEELFSARERMAATSHPKIHKVMDGQARRQGGILDRLTALEEVVSNGVTPEEVKLYLEGMIEECDGGASLN